MYDDAAQTTGSRLKVQGFRVHGSRFTVHGSRFKGSKVHGSKSVNRTLNPEP
jgi:hypothetical protein